VQNNRGYNVDVDVSTAWFVQNNGSQRIGLCYEKTSGVWGETDPAKALLWATHAVGDHLREALLPNLLISLKDAPAVNSLLDGLSADARDAALVQAIKSVPQGDAALALSLARQIGNQTTKSSVTGNILAQSFETEPQAQ
jgi:hypothetical protein